MTTLNPENIYSSTIDEFTFVSGQIAIQLVDNFVLIRTEHFKLLTYESNCGNASLEDKHVLIKIFTYSHMLILDLSMLKNISGRNY